MHAPSPQESCSAQCVSSFPSCEDQLMPGYAQHTTSVSPDHAAPLLLSAGYCPPEEDGAPMMVLELMKYGDLQSFLQGNKWAFILKSTECCIYIRTCLMLSCEIFVFAGYTFVFSIHCYACIFVCTDLAAFMLQLLYVGTLSMVSTAKLMYIARIDTIISWTSI